MPNTAAITRRQALQGSLAAALTAAWARSPGQAADHSSRQWILIGDSTGQGIYRARWNGGTGEIGTPELAAPTAQPTFLTRHPHLPVLYACNETDSATTSGVSAFRFDPQTAALTPLDTQLTQGSSPCYASVDRTGSLLFTANYGGGSLSALPLDGAGRLEPAATVFRCPGSTVCGAGGPVQDRQTAAHIHCVTLAPDNRFVLACDLGDDAILVFPVHLHQPAPLGQPVRVAAVAGSGPRHLAFHPHQPWLYCINELDCTVTRYDWRVHKGAPVLQPVPADTVSVLPAGAKHDGSSTGAELAFSSDGRFLYTSTRSVDVLTVFSVHAHEGSLTQVQQVACGGRTPRFFALDPTERWLLCAHQDGNTITAFHRDNATGMLESRGTYPATNPECLLWL